MLVRLVVMVLCLAWSFADFQCPGPGRFSTSPGFCTNEYYTCNREANREYVAYVLSCPGNTIFNERTRKCSTARMVSCMTPTTPTASGSWASSTIPSTRPNNLDRQASSWTLHRNRPIPKTTTKRSLRDHRKPTQPRKWTRKPSDQISFTTKSSANQWRIKLLSTERKTTSTLNDNRFLPTRVMTAKNVTNAKFPTRIKVANNKTPSTKRLPTKSTRTTDGVLNYTQIPHQTISQIPLVLKNLTSTTLPITAQVYSSTTVSAQLMFPTTLPATMNGSLTNIATVKFTTGSNIKASQILTQEITASTEPNKLILQNNTRGMYEQVETQITPAYTTHPMVIAMSPTTSSDRNSFFETTPEIVLKNNITPKIFLDSLENERRNDAMEIVYVPKYFESYQKEKIESKNKGGKNRKTIEHHIPYFYEPDINIVAKESKSTKKGLIQRLDLKRRQPK